MVVIVVQAALAYKVYQQVFRKTLILNSRGPIKHVMAVKLTICLIYGRPVWTICRFYVNTVGDVA